MESIQINEPTEAENITLEQQAAMQDEAKQQRETQQTPVQEEAAVADEAVSEETSEPPERPEWLPEKFESAEDMAQAYASLEKDFHAKGSEEAEPSEVEQPSIQEAVGSTVTKASEEFSESGQLSEQTYAALEANGISRDFVEMYIEGVTSVSQQQTSALMSDVGGQENYEAMSEWASTALTDDEQAVFNETVEAGDPRAATMAIRGVYARFIADGGSPVSLVQGDTQGSGARPFNSAAQVTEAMKDPRYGNDPAYRAQVEQRLAISTVI
jgi:hypothetical protein|tara:strand:+ start:1731 stop:2540 length:810 start_codon:yes stop_codon:yes gene_type:complete